MHKQLIDQNKFFKIALYSWAVFLTLWLQGCSSSPAIPTANSNEPLPNDYVQTPITSNPAPYTPAPVLPPQPRPATPTSVATIQQANTLLQQGRKLEAAQAYFEAAHQFDSPQKERIIIQAAEITASVGDQRLTQQYLSRIPQNSLNGENFVRLRYTQALLALQNNQANIALRLLPPDLERNMSGALVGKLNHVRNKARQAGAQYAQAPSNTALPPTEQMQANQQPAYPVSEPAIPVNVLPNNLERLAVLLPKSGRLGSVAAEIYKGIQAAQAQVGSNTRIKFYDVGAGGALSQYQQAVAEGADMIVGPLDKESLATLLRQPQALSKPILSLNYLDNNNTPGTLFQFGLAPEDEAQQLAAFALRRGQRNALVMVPNSNWGERLAQAFSQTYTANGGNILSIEKYPNSPSGYLQNVQRALAAGQGREQIVFLAASPTQARLMRPLLQAQAGLLPVYATSHIFSGKPDATKDNDLDGIIYTEIPWVLERSKVGRLGENQYPRMFALGIDAFLIAKNIASLSQGTQALKGKTGQIRLLPNRRIQRALDFATFINGEPVTLGQ